MKKRLAIWMLRLNSMAGPLSPNARQKTIVSVAESWIGTPYRHQASSKHVGCDCLGLVAGIWKELSGEKLDYRRDYSRDWAECAETDLLLAAAKEHLVSADKNDPEPGDVLVFRWSTFSVSKHLAIMAGENQMIHAFERHAVCRASLVPQWKRRISGVFRFPQKF